MSLTTKRIVLLALGVMLVCAVAPPAHASLLTGDTIRTWELYPNLSTIYAGPVDVLDPGSLLSFPGFAPIADITFSDANITITMDRDATAYTSAFNGFRFFDVSESPFGSVTLDSATDVPGIDASRVTFDSRDIYVNFSGITYSSGEEVSLDLRAVPEPSSLLMLLMTAALLTHTVRCRKQFSHRRFK